MTKTDWRKSCDPEPMLTFLAARTGERQLRLFHCACCRRIWDLIADERGRQAVVAAERFAEGLLNDSELQVVRHEARRAVCEAKRIEWIAEAETDFRRTPKYCATTAKLYALCAALAAASSLAAKAHGGWEYYQQPEIIDPLPYQAPLRASHSWAAAAVGEVRHGQVLAAGKLDDFLPIVLPKRTEWLDECLKDWQMSWPSYLLTLQAELASAHARAAKAAEQAVLLRRLFDYPFADYKMDNSRNDQRLARGPGAGPEAFGLE